MASSIVLSDNGASSGSAGLKSTAGNDGVLILQTTTVGGTATTAVTIGTDQSVTTAGTINGLTVGRGAGSVSTNTAVGASALAANTTGTRVIAVGYQAALSNTEGTENVAVGSYSFDANTTGSANTAIGDASLSAATTASNNTAIGSESLKVSTTGANNTAVGKQSLFSNTTASNNTAVGYQAGYSNTTGAANTFIGYQAGYSTNRTDSANGRNVFVGEAAGYSNTTGRWNTYLGHYSGQAMTTGQANTIIGRYDGNQGGLDIRTASNYIVLSDGDGNPRARWDNNGQGYTVGGGNGSYAYQILNGGNSNPYGLYMQFTGASPNNTSQYFLACADSTTERFRIYSNGTYGSVSDSRLKKNIETSRGYLSDLCQLRVVKYGWNTNDDSVPKELGFIAQEVEEVFPSLVDNSGEYKMIKQPVLIPMLVKAIQELKESLDSVKAEFDAYKEAHP